MKSNYLVTLELGSVIVGPGLLLGFIPKSKTYIKLVSMDIETKTGAAEVYYLDCHIGSLEYSFDKEEVEWSWKK